jgi:hypothetical protein
VLHSTPSEPDPLRPHERPSRNAAAQRRAMQAAMANAVRAMRSAGGGRSMMAGRRRRTPRPPAGS